MFNGVPDQFHQFGPSLPFPLSFPLHHHGVMSPTTTPIQNFPPSCFDLYHPSISTPQEHVLQIHQQQSCTIRKEKEEEEINILARNNVVEIEDVERSIYHESSLDDLWSNDEVVALFKIRSGLENWFPDFTWDHVSRKLAEVGYQRSAEKCREKFEEESRQLNDINYNKNYRFLTEINELYHVEIPQIIPHKNPISEEQNGAEDQEKEAEEKRECDTTNLSQEIVVEKAVKKRKRKDEEFEMLMGFCGSVVKKVIEKQEEMHNKLIENIVKKEEESIAREEAWRIQESIKIEKEIELRVQEKANASEKQAQMIDLLKKFIPFDSTLEDDQTLFKKMEDPFMSTSNHSKTTTLSLSNDPNLQKSSSKPSSPQIQDNPHVGIIPLVSSTSIDESFGAKDTGKRWPREEVLALINIRCKFNNNNNNNNNLNEDKDSATNKGPLWERISKGMMEMGYKRSAKRCKEKWENINKYFRKTKDTKKKRAQDSRTCPYFQQLSSLYTIHQQGSDLPKGHSDTPEGC